MSLNMRGRQQSFHSRRNTWINNEEIELMMDQDDADSSATEFKNGTVNHAHHTKMEAKNGEMRKNESGEESSNVAKGRRIRKSHVVKEGLSTNYFSDDDSGDSDGGGDVGETSVPNATAADDDEEDEDEESMMRMIAATASRFGTYQPKEKHPEQRISRETYHSQTSTETSASEQSSSSRRHGGRRRNPNFVTRSTSTPSLDQLLNINASVNSSFIVRKKDDSSWRQSEYGKPRLAQRRSLSPSKHGDGGGKTDELQEQAQTKPSPPEDNNLNSLYDNPASRRKSSYISSFVTVKQQAQQRQKQRRRRRTIQDASSIRRSSSLESQDDDELMDPNAMRYLPKILRDVYAQRQRRRDSQLGNARLASIDLRLRLQRPDLLPHYQDIRGSILILDLSGFTALGERLRSELGPRDGAAEFANRVNSTLTMMVKQVHKYWGDVLMFAGDALICLFEEKVDDDDLRDESTGELMINVENKTKKRVRDCCLSVLGKLASDQEFSIHGGSAHGMIRCFFLGTLSKTPGSCAFVVSGHPLKETGNLLNKAGQGEVFVDGEELPITEKEGILFLDELTNEEADEDDYDAAAKNYVSPRDSALLSDAETSVDAVGGFGVNAYARAFLGTLAARRLDQGSQNAMSMLLNELRPVAIVFVGLHDLDDIDPRDSSLLQLMNEAFKILSRITHSCNGAVRDMLFDDKGCVFISVFGAHSHEVNPCFDATVSAMRMENALKGLKLNRFSLGVSFGECFCGEVGPEMRSDYVVMGPEVNMAARLMSQAPNRGTLVSKRIFSRSNDFIHFEKSEKIQVKGKDGLFHAYIPRTRIDNRNVEIAATQQPFVLMRSRQAAMNSLVNVKDQAASGEPAIAFVSGGPFLGKSRLIDEVAAEAALDGFTVLKSFRTSLDSFTSFFPLRQIVAKAMMKVASDIYGEDFSSEVAAADYLVEVNVFKKTDRVNIGSIVPQVADAQLLSLLRGMNPNARTRSIVDSMMKILKLLNPLIIILEGDGDIDPSSWSLLAEIMQRAREECPTIMIIVSSRNSPTITSAASSLRQNAVQVKLAPFEKSETEQYLRFLLQIEDSQVSIDQRLVDVVHDRANGCPLFIESVARWAHEKNLIEFVEGSKKMTLKLDERSDDVTDAIPRELSNILLAPFNHLSPPLWDALKIASCIGYSFDSDLYRALNQELDLIPKIEELSEKYGCFEHIGTQFRWKQQAVYEAVKSLLMANQRQIIHRMIVDAFRANDIDPNDLILKGGDVHRLLGRHCALAEDWAAAFEQYIKAGDRAKAAFNFNEASKMYEEAIDYQAKMKAPLTLRSRMIPTINLGACFRELARYREAETVLTRCLNEAETSSAAIEVDDELYVRALTAMAALYQARSNYDDARKLYEKAVPIARKIQESGSSLWLAGNIAGYAETLRKSGDLPQAELHHREALEIRTRAVEEKSCTELELAVSYTQLGCTLAGMRRHSDAYQQHHRALGLRYRYLDFTHGLVSESMNYCAESLCALGRGVEGIPLALHAVEIRRTIFGTAHPAYAHALSVLASCYQSVGRSFDARDCLEKCLEICEVAFQQNHANIIPNLMNYGNVLRSTGDLKKARSVYQRAIDIHQLNFKEGQQASRLEKCRAEVDRLRIESERSDSYSSDYSSVEDLSSLRIHPEPAVVPNSGTPVIVFTDIGRDVDDEMALVLLSALRRKHLLNPQAVIATLSPERDRANLARGSLDVLGMGDVPVGIGGSGGATKDLEVYKAVHSRSSQSIEDCGIKLACNMLRKANPKSVQILCLASLSDLAVLINDHEELFTAKVKEVVVMGGLLPIDSNDKLLPDTAYNNNCDMEAARFVYESCQELRVPTVTLSRWTAYGCPVRPKLLDELARTEHMVATNIRKKSKESIDQLWKKVVLPPEDPGREKLPSRCDAKWFYQTFIGEELPAELPASVWNDVQKLNMYDPLAVLMCVSSYRSSHFRCREKVVNRVTHLVVGVNEQENGIRNRTALFDEYSALFLYAMQASLNEPKIQLDYDIIFDDVTTSTKRSALVNRAA